MTPSSLLAPILAALAGIDIASTRHVLDAGGFEGNPFMVPIVGDLALFFTVKIAVVLVICGIAWVSAAYLYPRAGTVVMTTAVLIASLPVVHNLVVIFG